MAVTVPRRRTKNPDGRMPLREHLVELRRRVLVSVVAIVLGAAGGWFLYDPVVQHLQQPLLDIAREKNRDATLNFGDVMGSLNLKIKLSVYLGILVSSPVWLYQIWGFVTPGLTRKERRYGIGFVAAAVPLFCGGVALAWFWLPRAVVVLTEFTPQGASNYIDAQGYYAFVTRLMFAFGLSFVVPLLLVALNFVGLLSGARMGGHWRIAIFACFLFAAIVSPSPDPGGMLAMAAPMIILYVLAVGIALWNDRRRRRRIEDDPIFGLDDDESSPLTSQVAPVGRSGSVEAPTPLDDPADDPYEGT